MVQSAARPSKNPLAQAKLVLLRRRQQNLQQPNKLPPTGSRALAVRRRVRSRPMCLGATAAGVRKARRRSPPPRKRNLIRRLEPAVFIGNVKVVDPQFTLTADRLTVHLNRDEEGGGLNDADAQGNVVIVHVNQPKTQGTPAQTAGAPTPAAGTAASGTPAKAQQPTTSTGKSDKALYEAKDGSITLTGWPQVTQGGNTHIATAPGVKMVLFKDGRMQTYGSTRTLIEDRTTATNNPNANGAQ